MEEYTDIPTLEEVLDVMDLLYRTHYIEWQGDSADVYQETARTNYVGLLARLHHLNMKNKLNQASN